LPRRPPWRHSCATPRARRASSPRDGRILHSIRAGDRRELTAATLRSRPILRHSTRVGTRVLRRDVGSVYSAPILSPTDAMIPEVQVFAQVAAIPSVCSAAVCGISVATYRSVKRTDNRHLPPSADVSQRLEPVAAIGRRDRDRGGAAGRSAAISPPDSRPSGRVARHCPAQS
jgi:hypothetical protein